MRLLPRLLLLLLLVFPATLLLRGGPGGSLAVAQDLTEDEETVEDSIIEDEDDEAEVEEDEPTDLGNVFQDAVFNQTVTIIEREDGLDGETIFMYMFLAGLGLLVVVGLHQLLESRKRKRPIQKVEMGTSSQNDVDMSWIPQETLNQINKASPRRLPRKRAQKRSVGSDECNSCALQFKLLQEYTLDAWFPEAQPSFLHRFAICEA
ncbi:translocon-associated protein subunit alpha isoform X4 [Tamandua tetradactyla]|uniref:translocon-associated protein subunit alpha isoform X4 n=1 Tax=Tamandua tetradactyla TaxID=48850 RepID=UPI00405396A9